MSKGTLYMVVGHYGSGKSEFSVNLAVRLREAGKKVALADIDILNPYFRSRESAVELGNLGIEVVSSVLGNDSLDDQPSVSARIYTFFDDLPEDRIVDAGGDPAGARILGSFVRTKGVPEDYELLMVINANRPETSDAEQTIQYLRDIEFMSGIKVTGLINNTHMLWETTVEDILRGDALVRSVSEKTGIPVKYYTFLSSLTAELEGMDLLGEPFPVNLMLRPEWL